MKKASTFLTFSLLISVLSFPFLSFGQADTADIKKKIEEHNATIKKLEQEITGYQGQIIETAQQAQTLNSTIKILDTTRKQLETGLTATATKIDKTNLTIEELRREIEDKEQRIRGNKQAIAESLRKINQSDSESMMELFLRNDSISMVWNDVSTMSQLQDSLEKNTQDLLVLQKTLEENFADTAAKKRELLELKEELAGKKSVVEGTKKEKADLLTQTKNQEAEYAKLLQEKVALKIAFEKELLAFESQLNFSVDPSSIPSTGSGVLSWPLAKVTITQQFGDTEFSRQNPGAYSGNGHNGVDFGIPSGTKVMSAGSGTVTGAGDTDTACPKASYGKWVLVQHPNGLSTLYAHLSVISVSEGQAVTVGQLVGLSGNTGFSTGPHLHFTVYATEGVRVMDRPSKVCGATYHMPVADLKAYLNPLLYL